MDRLIYDQLLEENSVLRDENIALRAENKALREEVSMLREVIRKLEAKIDDLQAKLGKNSKNSSKPPSSDQKSNLPSLLKKDHRPYHAGASHQLLTEEAVTSRETRFIGQCPRCRSKMIPTNEVQICQQVEMPPLKLCVHQIELITSECPCCKLRVHPQLSNQETFLLGPRMEAFVNLLIGQFRQGHRPVRSIISALFPSLQLSQGLISKIKARAATAFTASYEELKEAIISSKSPLYTDATSWRHLSRNECAIVMRSEPRVAFAITPNQNKETIRSLLRRKIELIVSDRGLAICRVICKAKQYCLSHLLRNIQGLAEHPGITIEEAQDLGELYDEIKALFADKHRLIREEINESTWKKYGYQSFNQIQEKLEELCAKGGRLRRFCRRVLRSLKHFRTYLRHPSMPMTNNPAEEALRNLVIARKICFGTRSSYGKKWRMVIHSCIETLHRQGLSVLDFMAETISAFRLGQQTPSLLRT
jgi:hypothetical protein